MLQDIIKQKPFLAWYVKNPDDLSDESALEHILSYGDWDDVMKAKETIGLMKMSNLFQKISHKKRANLSPRTINYFQKYFQKYA